MMPAMPKYPVAVALAAAAGLALLLSFLGWAYVFGRRRADVGMPADSGGAADALAVAVLDRPRPLPEIAFADGGGRTLSLADFRGRTVLLNLWATWCVPCRKEMPSLDRLQGRLGGGDFIVVPVSLDRAGVAAVRRFYREVGVENLGIFVDPAGGTPHALGIPGVPTTLLIDREGREVARKMGEAEWDGPEMVGLIRRLIETEAAR